jgi:hypothetical protein
MRTGPLFVPLVLVFSAAACGGEQRSPQSEGWSNELADTTGQVVRQTEVVGPSGTATPAPLTSTQVQPTRMGVRPDVMIAPDAPHEATCACLSVVVADVADPRLSWQNERPLVGQDAAVIAVSAKGVTCAGQPEDAARRPSIAGVTRDGADVVVEIEELPPGRPIASGAVIPRPDKGGSVYVRGRGKVPYARTGQAGGRCKVQ